jgi:hypothetical protein
MPMKSKEINRKTIDLTIENFEILYSIYQQTKKKKKTNTTTTKQTDALPFHII